VGDTLRPSSHAGETPDDVLPGDPEEQPRGPLRTVAVEFPKAPYSAWTPVGVTELWPPEAVLEIT
jgi:hypothetical protein